jgi:hypothetical protein
VLLCLFINYYIKQYMKLIQDPAALQAAMEQFAAEGLESSLGGLGDGLEEYTVRYLVIHVIHKHTNIVCACSASVPRS